MKVIFLDIDGVLNGYSFWSLLGWEIACKLKIQNWYRKNTRKPHGVHKEKVKRLAKIVKKTGAKIVMTSTWRGEFWKTPFEEKSDNQKKLTLLFKKYDIQVIGITKSSSMACRQEEIMDWLSKNGSEVEKYIVIDDEKFDLSIFEEKCLIYTNNTPKKNKIGKFSWYNKGLKNKHVKEAINLLN